MTRPFTATGQRRTTKTISEQIYQPKNRVVSKFEIDSSSYRLSKVPQKFSTSNMTLDQRHDPFSVRYFKEHPDEEDDEHSPLEKLNSLENADLSKMDEAQKFTYYAKKKALIYMAYGENSREALGAHLEIGDYYQDTGRAKSALRHYFRAHTIESSVEVDLITKARIATGKAECNFAMKKTKKKDVSATAAALEPYLNVDIGDEKLCFRIDLLHARILYHMSKFQEALEKFKLVLASTDEIKCRGGPALLADLYYEAGYSASYSGNTDEAVRYFQRARDIYKELENLALIEEMNTNIEGLRTREVKSFANKGEENNSTENNIVSNEQTMSSQKENDNVEIDNVDVSNHLSSVEVSDVVINNSAISNNSNLVEMSPKIGQDHTSLHNQNSEDDFGTEVQPMQHNISDDFEVENQTNQNNISNDFEVENQTNQSNISNDFEAENQTNQNNVSNDFEAENQTSHDKVSEDCVGDGQFKQDNVSYDFENDDPAN